MISGHSGERTKLEKIAIPNLKLETSHCILIDRIIIVTSINWVLIIYQALSYLVYLY